MYSIKDKCSVTSDRFFPGVSSSKLDNNSCRSNYINNNRLTSALSYNPKTTVNSNQSPKINSGKYRETFQDKVQGNSLLDVNQDKICKGPKFPFNYVRNLDLNKPYETFYLKGNETSRNKTNVNFRNEENKKYEIKNMSNTNKNIDVNAFNKTASVRSDNTIKIYENLVKNPNEEEKEKNKASSVSGNKLVSEEVKFGQSEKYDIENKEKSQNDKENLEPKTENKVQVKLDCVDKLQNIIKTSTNNLQRFKNIVSETTKNIPFENSSAKRVRTAGDFQPRRTEFDLHMSKNPKNAYEAQKHCAKEYERMIKTSHDQRRVGNQILPNTRLINQKMLESDIFFNSNKTEEKLNLYGTRNPTQSMNNFFNRYDDSNKNTKDYLTSDIFVQRNNETSQKKIGERYLFNENKYLKIGYHPSAKSNSEWSPRSQVKSLMNHNSCEYDLFNPHMKKSVYTRDKIQSEANGQNPVNRQKSITEFVDLTRNFVPNYNKEFVKAIGKEERIFSKKQELCVNFLELHKEYNNICDRPFIKKMV